MAHLMRKSDENVNTAVTFFILIDSILGSVRYSSELSSRELSIIDTL